MKRVVNGFLCTSALAAVILFVGTSSVFATPASPGKGTGCFVADANGDYTFDPTCKAHDVLKLDREGKVAFYHYQDQGQLPADAPHPSRTIRNNFEDCLYFSSLDELVCGTVNEVITPSGVYKSSFDAH